jgi:hypothetical protein
MVVVKDGALHTDDDVSEFWMRRRNSRASRMGRSICLVALTIAAEGGKADIAKPMHGMGSGVFEIALPFKGDAFRVVYAVQVADEIWVVGSVATFDGVTGIGRRENRLGPSHADSSKSFSMN